MYKITFHLTDPICFIDRPVFDSILAYAYVKEKNGFVAQKLNLTKEEMIDFSLMPLKLHKNGYFIASQMFFDEAINFTGSWKKRWDNQHDYLVDFGEGKKRKIEINKGEFKSYDMPLNLYSIPEVYFVFDSDNVNEVERLIEKHIAFIGKKGSQGYGMFDTFSIDEIDLDFDKNILRPIPVEFLIGKDKEGYEIKYTSWKPPYWLPINFEVCGVPK